jgi:hypothetical protein
MVVIFTPDMFPYDVRELSRSEKHTDYKDKKTSAERVFLVPWVNRIHFASSMLRQRYPELNRVYCTDFEIKGEGAFSKDAFGNLNYDDARITLKYQSLDREPEEEDEEEPGEEPEGEFGANVDIELDFGQRTVDMPEGAFKFPDGTEASNVHKRIGTVIVRVSVEDLPSINKVEVSELVGHTNDSQLFGFEPGHVLLDGVKARQKRRSFESNAGWQATAEFAVSTEEWNKFPHPETGQFEIVRNQDGETVYQSADITKFLKDSVGGLTN